MTAVILYRIDETKHIAASTGWTCSAIYSGAGCLLRAWGRIGTTGNLRSVPFPTPDEARAAMEAQKKAKERRGYCQNQETK